MDRDNIKEVHQLKSEPWKVTLVDMGDLSQSGGRLRSVRPYLDNSTFCFTYGDGFSDVDIGELIKHHHHQGLEATLTAAHTPGRYGALHWNGVDMLQFQEKPDGDNAWINGCFLS